MLESLRWSMVDWIGMEDWARREAEAVRAGLSKSFPRRWKLSEVERVPTRRAPAKSCGLVQLCS